MKKTLFILLTILTLNGNALTSLECPRPRWMSCRSLFAGRCVNTRQSVLIRDRILQEPRDKYTILSRKEIKDYIAKGTYRDFYTDRFLDSPREVQIDHVRPWQKIRNGMTDCDKAYDAYNDESNLVVAGIQENQSKSNLVKMPFKKYKDFTLILTDEKVKEMAQIECRICKKWHLNNCDDVKDSCNY